MTSLVLEVPDMKRCPWCTHEFARPGWASDAQWAAAVCCSRACARHRQGALMLPRRKQDRAERAATIDELLDAGLTRDQIAAALGVKPYSLTRWTARHAPHLQDRLRAAKQPKPRRHPKRAGRPKRRASTLGLEQPMQPPLHAFVWILWTNQEGEPTAVDTDCLDPSMIRRLKLQPHPQVTCLSCGHDWDAGTRDDAQRILDRHLDEVHRYWQQAAAA